MTRTPRLILAGLSGGSGKTIISLGLVRALSKQGIRIAPFKKGPDYIDAAWLSLAAGHPATNLDAFLMDAKTMVRLFAERAHGVDLAFVEGNRGLFDGGDVRGSFSTSRLARDLAAPVILVLDATKMTRTVAAIVQGCAGFEPDVTIAGVIVNRTASERHRRIVREAIERYTDVPVLGTLPKLKENPIPERHMGLISNREYSGQEEILSGLAKVTTENCDLDKLLGIARKAGPLAVPDVDIWPAPVTQARPRIGYVLDGALWFYYQENLEVLRRAGAELVEVNLLDGRPWPALHGLYLGGGFPETQAGALAENTAAKTRVLRLSRAGAPIYAECGGFMYLCEELRVSDAVYPMAGVFPLATVLYERPQGLGYAEASVVGENIFHPLGASLKGHEFHYSRCLAQSRFTGHGVKPRLALRMTRGTGMLDAMDGALVDNTFAAYMHIHALGAPAWAQNFVRRAAAFAKTATSASLETFTS